jgi:hypothetical protein
MIIKTASGDIATIDIDRPAGGPLVVGTVWGGESAPANLALRSAAARASSIARAIADIEGSLAGPAQKGALKREAAGRELPAIEKDGQTLRGVRDALAARIATATAPAAFGPTTAYWQVSEATELARMYAGMTPAQKATTIHAAIYETSEVAQAWSRALQLVSPAITGVDSQQRHDLAVSCFARRDPSGFQSMTTEIAQISGAIGGLRRIADFVAQVVGTRQDWAVLAPTAALVVAEPAPAWGASERVLATLTEGA